MEGQSDQIVVVGSGIIGLASALLLAQDGWKIVVVARDLPGDRGIDWASPYAGANICPPHEMGNKEMAKDSFTWYQRLAVANPASGVQKVKATEYFTDKNSDDHIWYKDIFPEYKLLPASELPSNCGVGFSYQTCLVNPDIFLPWLQQRLEGLGTKFIRAQVKSLAEAARLAGGAAVVVNASGLGARELASDEAVQGYRGQTMLIKSDYDEVHMIQGSEYTYVIPRPLTGGVIIGGVSQEGAKSDQVDTSLRQDILDRVNKMTNNRFAHIDLEKDVMRDIVGIRPGRTTGMRVEREGKVVHAYGLKGAGYIYSFGVATRVRKLVSDILLPQASL